MSCCARKIESHPRRDACENGLVTVGDAADAAQLSIAAAQQPECSQQRVGAQSRTTREYRRNHGGARIVSKFLELPCLVLTARASCWSRTYRQAYSRADEVVLVNTESGKARNVPFRGGGAKVFQSLFCTIKGLDLLVVGSASGVQVTRRVDTQSSGGHGSHACDVSCVDRTDLPPRRRARRSN